MIATHSLSKQYGRRKDRYLELIQQFPLKSIQSEEELESATAMIHSLIDQKTLSEPEKDYLEILSNIVYEYEEVHYPMGEDTLDHEMLEELMTDRDLTQAQFAKAVGMATSTVSEILKGKRELTRKQLEKVSDYFKVSMDLFRTRK
jgi:HTH-type transcriptional regulator / antitoxin HigA